MKATERYLRRATWGMWGQKRRETQAELLGVIEDKLWRFKLLGLSEQAAEARALAELGKAGALASGLSRVHSLPLIWQGVLLVGVLGISGVQMVGAAAGVQAVPYQSSLPPCQADSFGGCAQTSTKLNYYVPVEELFSALKKVGLDPQALNLVNHSTDIFGGKKYYSMFGLITSLLNVPNLALHLRGEHNPALTLDTTDLRLGTSGAPVLADSLILPAVWTQLESQFQAKSANDHLVAFIDIVERHAPSLQQLSGLPGGRYALVTSINDPASGCGCGLQLRLTTVQDGLLPLINSPAALQLVDTPEAFAKAKANGLAAVLVYRVGTIGDLRNIPLTPVKISGLKIVGP